MKLLPLLPFCLKYVYFPCDYNGHFKLYGGNGGIVSKNLNFGGLKVRLI